MAVWVEMKNFSSNLEVEVALAEEVSEAKNPRSLQTQRTTTTALWVSREALIKRRLRKPSKSWLSATTPTKIVIMLMPLRRNSLKLRMLTRLSQTPRREQSTMSKVLKV